MAKFFDYQVRTRYAETDQMGVIYYGNYPQYLEIARVEYLRSIGVSYKEIEKQGVILPVVSLHLDYKKPALYDEVLTIRTLLKKLPTNKIEFDYEIYNEEGALLSTANTILVFVDTKTWKPIRCPEYIFERIRQAYESE